MNTQVVTESTIEVTTPVITNPVLRLIIDEVCVGEEFALLRKTLEIYAQMRGE